MYSLDDIVDKLCVVVVDIRKYVSSTVTPPHINSSFTSDRINSSVLCDGCVGVECLTWMFCSQRS